MNLFKSFFVCTLLVGVNSQHAYSQLNYAAIPHDTTAVWTVNSGLWAAQNKKKLISDQPTSVKSIRVAASGTVVVLSTNGEFKGYDPETGATRIQNVPAITTSSYKEISNSPFVEVEAHKKVYVVNSITGDVISDSKEGGIKKISKHFFLPNSASVLYVGRSNGFKSGMIGQNLITGEEWIQEDIFSWKMMVQVINGAPFELNENEFILPLANAIYCVNTKTGELKWRTYIPFTTPVLENEDTEPKPALLFKHKDKSYIYMINELGLTAYDLESGSEVWKFGRPTNIESKAIFTPKGILAVSSGKIQLFDYDTGDKLLKKSDKLDGHIYFHEYINSGIAVGVAKQNALKQEYTELNVLDPNTGLFKFEDGFKTYGNLMQILPCDKGIFYTTDRCVGIWDQETGLDVFEPVSVSSDRNLLGWDRYEEGYISGVNGALLTRFKGANAYVYNTEAGVLFEIDTKTGVKKQLGVKIEKFNPDYMEIRESGVYLSSQKTMVLLDYDGKLIYQKFFPTPEETAFEKFRTIAEAVYANYAQSAVVMNSGAPQLKNDMTYSEDANYSYASMQKGNASVTFRTPKTDDKLKSRLELSAKVQNFNYCITSLKNGEEGETEYGVVKVNKDTGEIERVFSFGQNRNPQFAVDEITQMMFYVESDKLHGYNLSE